MLHDGFTLWLTGLPGAGKSTLSQAVEQRLKECRCKVEVLDGDTVRAHLSKGLGFSREDRDTNIRRIAFVCNLLTRNGVICISATISPYREARARARREIGHFIEVFVKCPIEVCHQRDVKGLYKLVDEGKLKHFTGIDDPYEEPENPELVVETDKESVEECATRILAKLTELGYLDPAEVLGDESEMLTVSDPVEDLRIRSSQPQETREVMNGVTDGLLEPHGGELVINMVDVAECKEWQERAKVLPRLLLNSRQLADLEMLAVGAYSPLTGFMVQSDYLSVVNDMHLSSGLSWPIPITLSASQELGLTLEEGSQVALVDAKGEVRAVMTIEEKYHYNKQLEARMVYRTVDEFHPGVRALYQQGKILLGGPVLVIALPHQAYPQYRHTPTQSRRIFAERGWKRVVGFQTRNPVHRAHEYIQKCALETADGLYLHPLVGDTKGDDIPGDVRIRCYEVLLEHYFVADRVVLGVLPAAMRYAGPREAVFHALIRKNYGCTHFIVGRDHAGIGNYYAPYDSHHIFAEFDPVKLGIIPMFFDQTFFCHICDSMVSSKTCPHGNDQHVTFSGTKVRQMLQAGEAPPREFSRPEVAKVLIEAMRLL